MQHFFNFDEVVDFKRFKKVVISEIDEMFGVLLKFVFGLFPFDTKLETVDEKCFHFFKSHEFGQDLPQSELIDP